MKATNNLQSIPQDKTQTYFNNYYDPKFDISTDVDNTVVSFFERQTNNKQSAKALAGALMLTAKAQNMDPMEVLQGFMKLDKGQLDAYLAMYLNLNRVGTSYLGVTNSPSTSSYVKRMILP